MSFDLHLHSYFSDGNWSPEDLVDEAYRQGLKTIALTDHDTTNGIERASTQASRYGINVIPAVEISTQMDGRDLHVLGYFVNKENQAFKDLLAEQKKVRKDHVKSLAEIVGIDPQFILDFGVRDTIGKAHIAKALVACGAACDLNEAYYEYLMPQGKYFRKRNFVDTAYAVEILSKSGAVPVLAHPPEKDLEKIVSKLIKAGLMGLEAYHALFGQHTENLLYLARKYNLLVTGGSDCHGPYPPFTPQIGGVLMPDFVLEKLSSCVFNKSACFITAS